MFYSLLLEESHQSIQHLGIMLYPEAHAAFMGNMSGHSHHPVGNGGGLSGLQASDKHACGGKKYVISHGGLGRKPL